MSQLENTHEQVFVLSARTEHEHDLTTAMQHLCTLITRR